MKIFRIILSLFLFGSAQNSSANDSEEGTKTEHRYIIKYRDGSRQLQEKMKVAAQQTNLRGSEANIDAQFLPIDNAQVVVLSSEEEVEAWQEKDEVEYVEQDYKRYYMAAEDTPYGIRNVKALDVTDDFVANRKVCIIDTGYDFNHPDLTSNTSVVTGYKGQLSRSDWTTDENGHGTHVAGTIAAIGGNGVGVVGVNRNGALKLHIVKALGNNGWVWASSLVAAVEECVASGSNIVNMSLGGGRYSKFEDAAYNRIFTIENVLLVAAAGNDGTSDYSYPASYDAVISVGATDKNNIIASFSQKNDRVDISAPGVQVLSTFPGGIYRLKSGTSMATPHVSGVAALVWSSFPVKTALEIKTALQDSALDLGPLGRDNEYGYGLVDAGKAFQILNGKTPQLPTSSPTPKPTTTPQPTPKPTPQSTPQPTPKPTTTPQLPKPIFIQIESGIGGECIDLDGNEITSGQPIKVMTCREVNSQSWNHGSDDRRLRSIIDQTKCLEAGTQDSAFAVFMSDCNGSLQQEWKYESKRLKNTAFKKYLGVAYCGLFSKCLVLQDLVWDYFYWSRRSRTQTWQKWQM